MVGQVETGTLDVLVRNLGGIERYEASFDPGVTVLVGRNATNRTSLLQSVAAALGGSAGDLRGGADAGHVRLEVDDSSATREFERDGGAVRVHGEPYTDDAALVDLFASLFEQNPARRAVERADGEELREIVMEPVDTEELQRRIESTRRELDSIERRRREIERQLGNVPALEQRRQQRADELAGVVSELEEVRAAVEAGEGGSVDSESDDGAADGDTDGTVDGDADGDADDASGGSTVVEELQSTRTELRRVRGDRETQVAAIDSLEEERASVEAELADLDVPDEELAAVESELESLQRRDRELSGTVSSLQSIVEFNEELFDGAAELPGVDGGDDPVAALDPESRQIECWTCGTAVDRDAVSQRLDDLRAVVEEKRSERTDVSARIDAARRTLEDLREHSERRDDLRDRRAAIEAEIEDRRERVGTFEEREAALQERVRELEAESAAQADREATEHLERYERISELEYERGQLEEELDRLDDEIAATEELDDEREQLEEQRDELESELQSLRGRIEAVEAAAIDTFDEHVGAVLDLLDYGNLERVWIERKPGADDDASTFDLHVVRADDDGAVYEDSVEHLSESEREVLGVLVALAGYLVHDVHETVPVMVLDSLEAIDADRIAALVDYLAEYPSYLLVALLPEDAQALSDDYDRLRMSTD